MVSKWWIGEIEGHIDSLDTFQDSIEREGFELFRGVEFSEEIEQSSGSNFVKGKIALDYLTEINRVQWGNEEFETKNNYILRIDPDYSLGLVENRQLQLDSTKKYEKTSEISTFLLVQNDFFIISGEGESERVLSVLEESLEIEIQKFRISVECVVNRIAAEVITGRWAEIDEYTQSASISGDVTSSNHLEIESGRQVFAIFKSNFKDTDVKMGVSEGSILIYSPYDFSSENLVQLVTDEIIPCVHR